MTIRRVPEDFRVEERLRGDLMACVRAEPPARGHVLIRLTKASMTTPEAVNGLAKAIGVKPGSIVYAGLKDKHAVTVQHVTAPIKPDTPWRANSAWAGRGWNASVLGFVPEALSAADLEHNTFTIVVRGLSAGDGRLMEERASVLADGPMLIFTNYFGDQRFGSARHGQGFAARHLVRGEFEPALRLLIATPARKDTGARRAFTRGAINAWGDWPALAESLPKCSERAAIETLAQGGDFKAAFASLPNFLQQMCVDAYQSFLWNAAARAIVSELPGRFESSDEFGPMVFAPQPAIPADLRRASVPLPSPKMNQSDVGANAVERVLASEGLAPELLRIPGLRRPQFGSASRALFAAAGGFRLSPPEPDEFTHDRRRHARTVRFELPSGAYATTLLRALGQ